VAPLHPLRHDARAFAARAGAALAVFFTIAVVLLAGGADQPLASAEAKGDTGTGDAAGTAQTDVPAPEPVLGEPPVIPDPPVTPEPPDGAPAPSGGDPGDDDDGAPSGGGKDEDGDDEDGSSGGGKGGNGSTDEGEDDEGEPSGGGGTDEEAPPPSGGGKGEDPGDGGDSDGSDDEPEPTGRPQVTTPAAQAPGSTPSQPAPEPAAVDPPPGSGTGELRDAEPRAGEPASGSEQERTARLAAPSTGDAGTALGSGGTAAGDAAGAGPGTADAPAPAPSGDAEEIEQGSGGGSGGAQAPPSADNQGEGDGEPNTVIRTVTDLVEVVPDSLKAALAALAALSVLLGIGYLLAALRARRLARQRRELLQEVGLLQTALLPPVPDRVGSLLTSVAYRPADGPGAGGDFYDVLPLAGGRVGFILGDVSGHGRGALARTAFMRYTLRAYLEAGLEPRVALQVAGRVIDENLGGDFATVLLAVHDPETGSLTYATAGHPAPIVVGPQPHDPVTAGSSPPIGVGVRTGLRQTTVPLVPGSVAALFTDGLMEARTEHGILGRERLAELLAEIDDDPSARRLIERVAAEAHMLSDDMAAVVVTPTAGVTAGLFRTEQLELSARELDGPIARRFLEACGLPEDEVDDAERDARLLADRFGGVVLHVVFGNRLRVEVLPRNVESIEAASRRVSAGSA
jgi:Stage II sporulation protein E (SpoIIE)